MDNLMDTEEVMKTLFVDWNSLILLLFILGVGYVGLGFIQRLRGKKISDLDLYDKVIRSILLGFLSFSFILTNFNIPITNKDDIFNLIGKIGLGLFIVNIIVCIYFSYFIYQIIYVLYYVKINIIFQKKKTKKK